MKTKLILTLAALLASPAFAAEEIKLMEVTKYSGFTMPKFSYSQNCDIGSGHSLVKTRRGESRDWDHRYNETRYTEALPDQAAVVAALKKAAKGLLDETSGPVDGPSDTYVGILEGKVSDLYIRLSGRNGGNGTVFRNTADGIDALVEFGALNCQLAPWTN